MSGRPVVKSLNVIPNTFRLVNLLML